MPNLACRELSLFVSNRGKPLAPTTRRRYADTRFGPDSKVALAIMSHSAVTRLRHYQGVSRSLMRRAMDRLDAILGE